jgi:hypothetical protein
LPDPAGHVIRFIKHAFQTYNPFRGEYGSFYFLLVSFIAAFFSVFTYTGKKTFIE